MRTYFWALFLALAPALQAQARPLFDYGAAWRTRTDDSRYMYVSGVSDGQTDPSIGFLLMLEGRTPTPGSTAALRDIPASSLKALAIEVQKSFDDKTLGTLKRDVVASVGLNSLRTRRTRSFDGPIWYTLPS